MQYRMITVAKSTESKGNRHTVVLTADLEPGDELASCIDELTKNVLFSVERIPAVDEQVTMSRLKVDPFGYEANPCGICGAVRCECGR